MNERDALQAKAYALRLFSSNEQHAFFELEQRHLLLCNNVLVDRYDARVRSPTRSTVAMH
jgi:hypothetical protein